MKKKRIILPVLCAVLLLTGCTGEGTAQDSGDKSSGDSADGTVTAAESAKEKNGILFIEAEDPLHMDFGSFKVGDKFTTYEKDENGEEAGVTVWVHMADKETPYAAYFTSDSEMEELEVDASGCRLDDGGCFTEEGVFTVRLMYKGYETTYEIRVENAEKE